MFFQHTSQNSVALLFISLMALLSGCGQSEPQWHAKNIKGVMPDLAFELESASGQRVDAADFKGQIRLLFFGYTSCPDVCPATLAYLHQVFEEMPDKTKNDVTAFFVSVDPERDTPEKLENYVSFFDNRIVGLTGSESTLRDLAKRYRTTFGYGDRDKQGNYTVSHSSAIYVFDQQGRIRLLLKPDMPRKQAAEDLARLAQNPAS